MEMLHWKFTSILWSTGIHSIANGGLKLCENDQDKFINNCDLRNYDDMTIWRMISKNEVLWLITQFTHYGTVIVSHSQVCLHIRICFDILHSMHGPKGNKV